MLHAGKGGMPGESSGVQLQVLGSQDKHLLELLWQTCIPHSRGKN